LENLVAVMGGPENLVEAWHNECWRLIEQKRSSTRLARMYEMLIVLMGLVESRSGTSFGGKQNLIGPNNRRPSFNPS
jgi:hypothetical protein